MNRRVWLQTHLFSRIAAWAAVLVTAVVFCACVEDDVNRGNEALRIGDYDRAVANFSKALDMQPANRDARYGLALAYYSIAEQNERVKVPVLDTWQRTVNEFRILSRVDSSGRISGTYSTSLFYLARATLASNAHADVLPLLDKSISLDSANYFSYNLKALVLGNLGRTEEAKKIFVYIVTKNPKFASAYLNLGNIYWSEGDIESAWDIWSMGHEALPENAGLARWTAVAEDSLKALVNAGEL
ncbi:MAG: tetratricopeptide repeat protein [Fibrobacter sp.]|nr:tetratricopeptide repeat protein [Fibrobacter sp.]